MLNGQPRPGPARYIFFRPGPARPAKIFAALPGPARYIFFLPGPARPAKIFAARPGPARYISFCPTRPAKFFCPIGQTLFNHSCSNLHFTVAPMQYGNRRLNMTKHFDKYRLQILIKNFSKQFQSSCCIFLNVFF